MNSRFRPFVVLILVFAMLVTSTGMAFGQEQLKPSSPDWKPDGLYIYEEYAPGLDGDLIGPRDVGHPDRKTLLSSYNYQIRQDDIDNWALNGSFIVQFVSVGVATYFQNPLGIALAEHFGGMAGNRLEQHIIANMEAGYFNVQSSQTYEFTGGDEWYWQYGSSYVHNTSNGNWSSWLEPAPFNMFAYGL